MKRYYSDAQVDDLRWILNPTAHLVTAVMGVTFEWTAGEGYLSRERFFLIAKVCAGINFMIAAFGMVTWMLRRRVASWLSGAGVLATSLLAAYSAAVVVNAARIAAALWLAARPEPIRWLSAAQAHRAEGILFYFGGLLLLHQLVQQFDRRADHPLATPVIWYYAVTIAIPLANGAAGASSSFVEHTVFVLALPILLVALAAVTSVMYAVFSRRPRCMDPKPSSSAVLSWWLPRAEPVRWPRLRPHNLRR